MKQITMTRTKKGKLRAYMIQHAWGEMIKRPMKLDTANLMIETGRAELIDNDRVFKLRKVGQI